MSIIQENIPENYCQKFMAECQRYFDSGKAQADRIAEIERINNLPKSRRIDIYNMMPIEVSRHQKREYKKMVKSEVSKLKNCSLIEEIRVKAQCAQFVLLFVPKNK